MNRRQFLAGGAAILSAGVWTGRASAVTTPMRCGVLGLNHAHALDVLEVLNASPDFEVVGVAEPDAVVRAQLESEPILAGVPWLSESELLDDSTIRMVAVESDVRRLLHFGRRVVDAAKHLHLDKPAGTNLPEFKALLDTSAEREVLVQMGYMFRYNPGFDLVRRAVKEGWLGQVYAIDGSMCTDLNAAKRRTMEYHPGGLMLELGCHLLDMVQLLLGPPQKVTPYLRHDGPFDDALNDNTLAVFEYDNALVHLESTAMEASAFPGRRFKVAGTKGSISLSPLEPPRARLVLREAAGPYTAGEHEVTFEDLPRHVRDFADLAACIRGESTFAYSREHDYHVQRTLLQACGVTE